MNINNRETAQTESIKFLGVLLDENLSWKTHIKYIENKISKNIGILFRARPFLNKKFIIITLLLVYSQLHEPWQGILVEHVQNKLEKNK